MLLRAPAGRVKKWPSVDAPGQKGTDMQDSDYHNVVLTSICQGDDCQGCDDCPDVRFSEIFTQGVVEPELPKLLPEIALEATPERFRWVLAYHKIQVRYDVRGMRQQVMLPWVDEWQDITDGLSSIIRETMETQPFTLNVTKDEPTLGGVLKVSAAHFNELMTNACAHYADDPLIEYLEELPSWDRIPRLTDWITCGFNVAEESFDLAEWASTYVFLGAVWRAYQPGTKLDEMPILIGKGGIGKSTALRYTLPAHLRYMFTDGLNLASQPKERIESLQGRAIVEAAEMQGVRRADMESLKAFLSRTDDGSTRLAYRHNPESMPRRCVIIGTADRNDPLPDDPNLRRFVPITLNDGDVTWVMQMLDDDRNQLWAEALDMYQQGVTANLPQHLKAIQAVATESARSRDSVLEDAITEWLAGVGESFTLEGVAVGIGIVESGSTAKLSTGDTRRIAGVLRQHGYAVKPMRFDGKLAKRWTKAGVTSEG